ncbi:MAG: imidazole glycerol phosphate synthase subunit HisF [Candidatus Diapherotrites archaeon]|uniref:Imidazole glycerol phosphate synthase subunit HisF n=1 Tax=Candidatus Iainarchaeum sp. TaxID=3101447 RepID=A0A938YTE7_9ARCH|nr:imidazole glycerol phosphate synthase subunit HisF [Candidatus Diapherotrites archaeon]
MLAKRVIACLDCDIARGEARVVKGVQFKKLSFAGKPWELAERYYEQNIDEICFLDISASLEKRQTMADVLRRTSKRVFVPLTVGGGIKSREDARGLFRAGADKVAVNTAALERPELVGEIAGMFGTQAVVVAIDAKKQSKEKWGCFAYGGRKATGIDAIEWAKKVEKLGAGEILLTSMDRDGTKQGFDIELTRRVSEGVNIPIIASGGAGDLQSIADVLILGKADAVLAASIFHYKKFTVKQVKEFLEKKGVEVRI